jgi:hypothetical protein
VQRSDIRAPGDLASGASAVGLMPPVMTAWTVAFVVQPTL